MTKAEAKKLLKRIEEARGELQSALEELKEGADDKISQHTETWLDGERGSAWAELQDRAEGALDEVESLSDIADLINAL